MANVLHNGTAGLKKGLPLWFLKWLLSLTFRLLLLSHSLPRMTTGTRPQLFFYTLYLLAIPFLLRTRVQHRRKRMSIHLITRFILFTLSGLLIALKSPIFVSLLSVSLTRFVFKASRFKGCVCAMWNYNSDLLKFVAAFGSRSRISIITNLIPWHMLFSHHVQ